MDANTKLIVLVAIINVIGGALVALLVLKAQETIPQIAPLPGAVFGGIAIWGQLTVGDMINPTIPELETLVLTAVVSALVGLLSVFSTLQADQPVKKQARSTK
jgi:FtsH-binding integral membrane protein